MLEHTRKRRTDTIELCFRGPAARQEEAAEYLKNLGFVDTSETVPWREAVPFEAGQLPGVCLSGARNRAGFSQHKLAELTGIPQRHLSEMENGKRAIGKERAKILAEVLNTDYRVFL
ncbi:MAG: transcriptional regulator [Deltaproteobacteria bacterium RIFOXYD12_FULL_50_9]|nr:MAG: transcriptional regulator [Deltaproteobacteria bacterium RIFOXYD12_FULL_50_9]